jgi:hypothetical protein
VVLAAVTGGLTNELHGGWPWWVADAAVTGASAGLTMWLVSASGSDGDGPVQVDEGGVYAGRDIRGPIRTRVRGPRPGGVSLLPGVRRWIGRGGVGAGRDITTDVVTDVEGGDSAAGAGPRTGP